MLAAIGMKDGLGEAEMDGGESLGKRLDKKAFGRVTMGLSFDSATVVLLGATISAALLVSCARSEEPNSPATPARQTPAFVSTPPSPTSTSTSSPSPTPTPSASPTVPPLSPTPLTRLSVPVSAEEVTRGDPSRPWLSLVFNAGAGYEPAPAILDVLRGKGVRTTFFPMGWWAEKQPGLVRQIADDGHEVASHGQEVFDLTQVSDAEVMADLERADAVISQIIGRSTRPLWSPSAGYRDARVRRLAASLGYRPIYWTADSGDWREDATAAEVRQRVLAGAANGSIIVMHFDSPRSADTISGVLPEIIDGLRAKGKRLVTISELITGELKSEVSPR